MGPLVQGPPTERHLMSVLFPLWVPDHKGKRGRGRVARLRQGQVPSHPKARAPGPSCLSVRSLAAVEGTGTTRGH